MLWEVILNVQYYFPFSSILLTFQQLQFPHGNCPSFSQAAGEVGDDDSDSDSDSDDAASFCRPQSCSRADSASRRLSCSNFNWEGAHLFANMVVKRMLTCI